MNKHTMRLVAGVGAGTLAITGLLAAAAPAALAGTVTPNVTCSLPLGQGDKSGPMSVTVDGPTTAKPGETVDLKITLGASPATSPAPLSGIKMTPSIDFDLSGGATGKVTLAGPQTTIDIPANVPIQSPPFSVRFQVPATADGTVELTPTKTTTATVTPYGNFETPCTVTSGSGVAAGIAVENSPETATLSASPGSVEAGKETTLAGTNWTPGATATPSLCAVDGTACNPAGLSANTLSIAAGGALSGTVTVAAGTADGSYSVQVTDGTRTASTPLTVKKVDVPVAQRKVTLSKSTVRPWTFVKVSGENFTPNTLIALAGVQGANPTFNFGVAWTDKHGKFSSWILVTSKKTTGITAVEIDTSFKFDKLGMAGITVK
ncbi:hypothetical protein [Streptomyces sp. SID3343]|uniref:hypothetical protein n=1 Tax=Streptomyces sp. SID3343 TaxID=2690260 RepID=UPI00136D5A22|nr:hypothetical protein [Streptomyces sp. SID3343]MYW02118.1 hypothetical protein [Streptomyces sp. SID3343]